MKRILLASLGILCLIAGIIGIVLPVLPTTPLVIAASILLGASFPRFAKKLDRMPVIGEFVVNYRQKTGVAVRTKAFSLTALWLFLILGAYFSKPDWVKTLLAVVGVAVTAHILLLRRKTA
ncbi:MAG: YbaN family protein [Oscillospiraceae bacterium]|nr:YbaN family protein [Oscillospiraceae bacterium]